ncbi:hypothetical protein ACHAP8_004024 [Fusarium lateritium]
MSDRSSESPGSQWLQFMGLLRTCGEKIIGDLAPVVHALFIPEYRVPENAIVISHAYYDKFLEKVHSPVDSDFTEEEIDELNALLNAFVNEIAPGYLAARRSHQSAPEGTAAEK